MFVFVPITWLVWMSALTQERESVNNIWAERDPVTLARLRVWCDRYRKQVIRSGPRACRVHPGKGDVVYALHCPPFHLNDRSFNSRTTSRGRG